jgi:hypothetical protein
LGDLAVDAAHILAIAHPGFEKANEWNLRGLEIARASQVSKARALIPAMLNNTAWDLHDAARDWRAQEGGQLCRTKDLARVDTGRA